MNHQQKTISIGLETATSALEKFLASGDLPNHCIDVFCTINREFKAPASSSQDLVLSFLESKLLVSACDTWTKEGVPPLLLEVISELFFLVTSSIFVEKGQISTSLSYRNNRVHGLVCAFYQYFFESASKSKLPVLLEPDNHRILEVFVAAIKSNPVFADEFVKQDKNFAPLAFFVENASLCHRYVADCMQISSLTDSLEGARSKLKGKIFWGNADPMELEKSWKFSFLCEILKPTPLNEFSLTLFHNFLESIQCWQSLLFMCIQLLKNVPQNSSVDSIIAEAVNCRLALFGSILGAGLFDDTDEMMVWCFLDTVLKGGSFDLVMGLFYEPCSSPIDLEPESAQNLRRAIFEFVGDSEHFAQTFAKELKQIYSRSGKQQECAIKLSTKRSLFGFLICRLQNFFANSTRVNRIIRVALFNLCVFQCSHSSSHPAIIYREFLSLVEAIHYEKPKEGEKSCTPILSTSDQSIENTTCSNTSAANSMNTFIVPDFLDIELVKDEGHRINVRLFESCLAIVYAAIKTRELRRLKKSS